MGWIGFMEITKKLYVKNRHAWRKWLKENHDKKNEIWLIYYKKNSGKPRIPYNDAVEEALCFGWIDGIEKGIDHERFAQRFTPRRPRSNLSATNVERIRRLILQKKMTKFGLRAISHAFDQKPKPFIIPAYLLKEFKRNKKIWSNFQRFPESYKRIRVGWIDASRKRPDIYKKRLEYFLKKTEKNEKFGMVQ